MPPVSPRRQERQRRDLSQQPRRYQPRACSISMRRYDRRYSNTGCVTSVSRRRLYAEKKPVRSTAQRAATAGDGKRYSTPADGRRLKPG